jgi:hypothetical protein
MTRTINVGPITVTRDGKGDIFFTDKTGSVVHSGSANADLVKLLDAIEAGGSGSPTMTTRTDA